MVGSLIAAAVIVVVTIALVTARLGQSDELRDGDGKSDDNSGRGSWLEEPSGPVLAGAGLLLVDPPAPGVKLDPETGKTPFHEL
jgi:hypothetical protein